MYWIQRGVRTLVSVRFARFIKEINFANINPVVPFQPWEIAKYKGWHSTGYKYDKYRFFEWCLVHGFAVDLLDADEEETASVCILKL